MFRFSRLGPGAHHKVNFMQSTEQPLIATIYLLHFLAVQRICVDLYFIFSPVCFLSRQILADIQKSKQNDKKRIAFFTIIV